jgi:lipoate-protein ligase A
MLYLIAENFCGSTHTHLYSPTEVALALAAGLQEVQRVAVEVLARQQHGGAERPHGPVQREHVQVVRRSVGGGVVT